MEVEISDELEVLKSIYESSIQILTLDEKCIELIYGAASGLQVNLKIDETYPNNLKSISVSCNGITDEDTNVLLREIANEYYGMPMLYALISKAEEHFASSKYSFQNIPTTPIKLPNAGTKEIRVNVTDSEIGKPKEKPLCQFFMKGKCKFKDKCYNIHQKGEAVKRKLESNQQRKDKTKEKEEKTTQSKKVSMKTATDVIHRILWDDALPTEQFIVGYLDRFIGVIEKPFSAFSWEDIASVDYNVLAIPKHRIQYFKYVDTIIWDKNKRLDKMFGSTGDKETIMDVIAKMSNVKLEETGKQKQTKELDSMEPKLYDEKNRPNFFICLPITNPEIKGRVKEAQDHMIAYDNRLSEICHNSESLHVTLCMMRLNSEDEQLRAVSVLKSLESLLPCLVPTNAFELDIDFIGHFGQRVIYAAVKPTNEFSKLAAIIKTKLQHANIHLCGNHDVFTPHLTMMKISRPFTEKTNIREINSYLFHNIQHVSFGRQVIDSLRLCHVGKDRGPDDFYLTKATVQNHFLKISTHLPSIIANNLTRKMSQGIIDESVGDSLLDDILSSDCFKFENAVNNFEEVLLKNKWKSEKVVVIVRGLPGSGKSHLVRSFLCGNKSKLCCSADGYFEEKAGMYKFDGFNIYEAHKQCRDRVLDGIQKDVDVIFVDNTHSQRWEYRIYERIAVLSGYKHYILEVSCDGESTRQKYEHKSVHHVKGFIHKEMFTRWEQDPQAITCLSTATQLNYDWLIEERSRPFLYSALFLDQESRDQLLSFHPARLKNEYADHMTLCYEPSLEHLKSLTVGQPYRVQIEKYFGNSTAQVVFVSELNSSLCTQKSPHITISTEQTFRPSDVTKLLESARDVHATNRVVLTGVVGVKVAVNEKESVRCVDMFTFKKLLKDCFDTDMEEAAEGNDGDNEDTSIGVFVGPTDQITCLNIFDFDSTLFFTPGPVEGRNKYQKLTGNPWSHRGWLSCNESLYSPLHVYPGPSLPDYKSYIDRASSYNIMCTGRLERVREGVEGVLALHGMTFDRLVLKPDDGENYSRTNVKNYKRNIVGNLLKEFPKVVEVNFWDDRNDNIQSIKSLVKYNKNIQFNLYHIQEKMDKNIYHLSTSDLFHQLGCTQDENYKIAVNEVMDVVKRAWIDVIGVNQSTQHLMHLFGSYLLNRRSDVDVCLIAPASTTSDKCIQKLADVLLSFGFSFVHCATGIRCPRLKLKSTFCGHSSITFDIVVACVIGEEKDADVFRIHEHYKEKKAAVALDGLAFTKSVVNPILDRISESELGMLVDALVILLRRNHLKGNAFHCIRTFHIVQFVAEFIGDLPANALPLQGLDDVKDFEKIVKMVLRHLASMKFEWYQKKFKGFVPDLYIPLLLDCFDRATRLSIEDILFQGPRSPNVNKEDIVVVELTLKAKDTIQRWKYSTLLEARFGSFARQLIDRGLQITPECSNENMIRFAVYVNGKKAKELNSLVKCFVVDFEKECKGAILNFKFN